MDEVKVIEVIYCTKKRRGKGTEGSPIRIVTEVFTKEGELIAEKDSEIVFTKLHMCKFAEFFKNCTTVAPTNNMLNLWLEENKINSNL